MFTDIELKFADLVSISRKAWKLKDDPDIFCSTFFRKFLFVCTVYQLGYIVKIRDKVPWEENKSHPQKQQASFSQGFCRFISLGVLYHNEGEFFIL